MAQVIKANLKCDDCHGFRIGDIGRVEDDDGDVDDDEDDDDEDVEYDDGDDEKVIWERLPALHAGHFVVVVIVVVFVIADVAVVIVVVVVFVFSVSRFVVVVVVDFERSVVVSDFFDVNIAGDFLVGVVFVVVNDVVFDVVVGWRLVDPDVFTGCVGGFVVVACWDVIEFVAVDMAVIVGVFIVILASGIIVAVVFLVKHIVNVIKEGCKGRRQQNYDGDVNANDDEMKEEEEDDGEEWHKT